MALRTRRNLNVTQVAQIRTFTITAASSGGGAVWTFTVTDSNGVAYAGVTYTETGVETEAQVAAGLVAAWNASSHPAVSRATASLSGDACIITSDVPGRPLPTITLDDDADGTDTETATQANVGTFDYGTALSWQGDAVPTTGDDVTFGPDGAGALYGLNQSGVAIGALLFDSGFRQQVGRIEDGENYHLRCDPDSLEVRSQSPLLMLDVGNAAIPALIQAPVNALPGKRAVYLKGSALTIVEIRQGPVGIGAFAGDTATVTTISVTDAGNPRNDANVLIGDGVTLTNLNASGGYTELRCDVANATVAKFAKLHTRLAAAVSGTLTLFGKATVDSVGTIAALVMHDGSEIDLTQDPSAKTISSITYNGRCIVRTHAAVTISAETFNPGCDVRKIAV